mmetsp:Transcript_14169/g.37540  ORF Transcript_14169/g.37540 Transcript_14169/m.37540 type:complete len:236 (+) Transcript_14169:738-1445(+)
MGTSLPFAGSCSRAAKTFLLACEPRPRASAMRSAVRIVSETDWTCSREGVLEAFRVLMALASAETAAFMSAELVSYSFLYAPRLPISVVISPSAVLMSSTASWMFVSRVSRLDCRLEIVAESSLFAMLPSSMALALSVVVSLQKQLNLLYVATSASPSSSTCFWRLSSMAIAFPTAPDLPSLAATASLSAASAAFVALYSSRVGGAVGSSPAFTPRATIANRAESLRNAIPCTGR